MRKTSFFFFLCIVHVALSFSLSVRLVLFLCFLTLASYYRG